MTAVAEREVVAAHGTRGPVPRWADWAAQATLWCVLPSGIWRILLGLGLPAGFTGSMAPDEQSYMLPYVIALTIAAEGVAFLSMGLVRQWGEVWPRWVPYLRGGRIHPLVATIPASLGAIALMAIWTPAAVNILSMEPDPEMPQGAKEVILLACYAPLLAWGPLLAAVTVAYAIRRRRHG